LKILLVKDGVIIHHVIYMPLPSLLEKTVRPGVALGKGDYGVIPTTLASSATANLLHHPRHRRRKPSGQARTADDGGGALLAARRGL
jgi:hypothetical protein